MSPWFYIYITLQLYYYLIFQACCDCAVQFGKLRIAMYSSLISPYPNSSQHIACIYILMYNTHYHETPLCTAQPLHWSLQCFLVENRIQTYIFIPIHGECIVNALMCLSILSNIYSLEGSFEIPSICLKAIAILYSNAEDLLGHKL